MWMLWARVRVNLSESIQVRLKSVNKIAGKSEEDIRSVSSRLISFLRNSVDNLSRIRILLEVLEKLKECQVVEFLTPGVVKELKWAFNTDKAVIYIDPLRLSLTHISDIEQLNELFVVIEDVESPLYDFYCTLFPPGKITTLLPVGHSWSLSYNS